MATTQPVAWPHYAGSTLRGAFGRALRRAACITGAANCQGCPLRGHCGYGQVFDPLPPTQPLHPSFRDGLPLYLIEPPTLGARRLHGGQRVDFALVVLPGVQPHHALIRLCLRDAVERELQQPGLFKLVAIEAQSVLLACEADAAASDPGADLASTRLQMTLRWHTPLRLQSQGRPVFKAAQLSAQLLVRALLRRQLQWHQCTQQAPADAALALHAAQECRLEAHNMHWHDLERRSGCAQDKQPMGGLLGSTTLIGPHAAVRALRPLFELGQHLHVGKETIMGLGRYRLGDMEPA